MKVPNIKFHGNPSSGGHADKDIRMDGHDEANRCFSLFMRTYLINGTLWLSVVPLSVLNIKNAVFGSVVIERVSLLLRIPEVPASIFSP